MYNSFSCFATVVLVFSLSAEVSYGQLDGLFEFDGGGDGTSWNVATNWEQVLDPNGNPISGDPVTPPDAVTSADIPLASVVIDSTMSGQTALDVNISTAAGAGSLNMSGGDLTVRDFYVGRDAAGANAGTFDISGGTLTAGDDIELGFESVGTMTMSDGSVSVGDDFTIYADSSLHVTGGSIHVGDRLITLDGNNSIVVDDGEVIADDDFFFFGETEVTVNGGLMQVADKLRFDDVETTGKMTINSGVVRANEFGFEDDLGNYIMNGVAEINGNGVLQVELGGPDSPFSQLTVSNAQALIAEGVHLTTSEVAPLKLGVQLVVVPEFFGDTDVSFVQISVVPEPASVLLLGVGCLGIMLRRRAL